MDNNKETSTRVTKTIIILSIIVAALSAYILLNFELAEKPLAGQGGDVNNAALIGGDFVLTDHNMETSIPGVFAAGDIRSKLLRQISTAVGEGATAAFAAERYIESLEYGNR